MSQLGDNEYLKNRCIEDLVYVNKRIASGRNLLDSFDAEKKSIVKKLVLVMKKLKKLLIGIISNVLLYVKFLKILIDNG